MFLDKFSLPIGRTLGLAYDSWNCDWSAVVSRTDAMLFLWYLRQSIYWILTF